MQQQVAETHQPGKKFLITSKKGHQIYVEKQHIPFGIAQLYITNEIENPSHWLIVTTLKS